MKKPHTRQITVALVRRQFVRIGNTGGMGYAAFYRGRDYLARPVEVFHWESVVAIVRETLRRHRLELVELGPKPEGDRLEMMAPLRAVVRAPHN